MVSTAVASPARTASVARTVLLLAAAVAVAGVSAAAVAAAALAVDPHAGFPPLMPQVYLGFVVLGVLAGYLGWRLVRARVRRPLTVLRVLVPVLLVLSLVPDTLLLFTGFIPGTTATGAVALMLMHPIVVAVG